VDEDRRAALERLLSPDEAERAARYLMPTPRQRFVVARGSLREILGRMTGLRPEDLRFSYPCVCGRPECEPSSRKPRLDLPGEPLRFNLTHTEGLAMVAVSVAREVGIDAERIDRRDEAFHRDWTRKEALAKAKGDGLVLGGTGPGEADGWWLCDLPAPPGYVASLAVEGRGCRVSTDWWP
jgi:4'-phosphopantetheinyl transferase